MKIGGASSVSWGPGTLLEMAEGGPKCGVGHRTQRNKKSGTVTPLGLSSGRIRPMYVQGEAKEASLVGPCSCP